MIDRSVELISEKIDMGAKKVDTKFSDMKKYEIYYQYLKFIEKLPNRQRNSQLG